MDTSARPAIDPNISGCARGRSLENACFLLQEQTNISHISREIHDLLLMHGAAPVTVQSSWLALIPLTQQPVLSYVGRPAEPHPDPPHWPHSSGQHTEIPAELEPSMPAMPLLHVTPALIGENACTVNEARSNNLSLHMGGSGRSIGGSRPNYDLSAEQDRKISNV